jgi:uncharacterized protein with NRDE domain
MCLILFAIDSHPEYNLIVAANRDEYYSRPTLAASFWNGTDLLAGKDLSAGGTWMGITRTGQFAALTNFRDPSLNRQDALSRGLIVYDYLTAEHLPEKYLKSLSGKADKYNGFNLIAGSTKELYYYSNCENKLHMIGSGIHALSNNFMDVPWPKVKRGLEKFGECLKHNDIDPGMLLDILSDTERPPDNELPDTGVGLERERMLSSIFIESADYGTRTSTVLLCRRNNHIEFRERNFSSPGGRKDGEAVFEFEIELHD